MPAETLNALLLLAFGLIACPVLAYAGSLLIQKKQSTQSLCLSQAIVFSLYLSLFLQKNYKIEALRDLDLQMPFILFCCSLLYFLIKKTASAFRLRPEAFYLCVFSLLVASSHFLTQFIEAKTLSQSIFGDLSSMNSLKLGIGTAIAFVLAFMSWKKHPQILKKLFEEEYLKIRQANLGVTKVTNTLIFAVLFLSVYYLGLLFTLCALFIPAVFTLHKNRYFFWIALHSSLAFLISFFCQKYLLPSLALETIFPVLLCGMCLSSSVINKKLSAITICFLFAFNSLAQNQSLKALHEIAPQLVELDLVKIENRIEVFVSGYYDSSCFKKPQYIISKSDHLTTIIVRAQKKPESKKCQEKNKFFKDKSATLDANDLSSQRVRALGYRGWISQEIKTTQ